jgi:hypothetical protein
VDRCPRPAAYSLAVLVLGTLLAAYLASRLVTLWPLAHTEQVDALGAMTKLVEAVGLLLALRLLQATAGSRPELPAQPEGAGP